MQKQYLEMQSILKWLLKLFLLTSFLAGIWYYLAQDIKSGKSIIAKVCYFKHAVDKVNKSKSEGKVVGVKKYELLAGNYVPFLIFLASFFWEGIKYVYRVMSNPKYKAGIPPEEFKKILNSISEKNINQKSHTIILSDTKETIEKKLNKETTTVNYIDTIFNNKKLENPKKQS